MPRPTRQRNLRGHGGLLRDEILSAATRVIDHAGSEGEVSLRRIAREAGIAAPSVYAHFEDRDDVVEAVAEASWVQVCDEIAARVVQATVPRDRLLLGCQVYVSFARRHPLRYALMTQTPRTPPAARQALDVVTRGLLACRADAGQAPPAESAEPDAAQSDAAQSDAAQSDTALARVAAALSVALHGVAMLHRTDTPNLWLSDFSTDQVIQTLTDAAILQLGQPDPGAT